MAASLAVALLISLSYLSTLEARGPTIRAGDHESILIIKKTFSIGAYESMLDLIKYLTDPTNMKYKLYIEEAVLSPTLPSIDPFPEKGTPEHSQILWALINYHEVAGNIINKFKLHNQLLEKFVPSATSDVDSNAYVKMVTAIWDLCKTTLLSLKDNFTTVNASQIKGIQKPLIICLGGDGTLMYANSLFPKEIPPIIAFHQGSVGFLAPFDFKKLENLKPFFSGEQELELTIRPRLTCYVVKGYLKQTKVISPATPWPNPPGDKSLKTLLNDVAILRGKTNMFYFHIYVNGDRVANVYADGIIISTPTGSTAYTAAVGASLVHPSVDAILITAICPSHLAFRPIIVPGSAEIIIVKPASNRSKDVASVSFDGKLPTEEDEQLSNGDAIFIKMASHPASTVMPPQEKMDANNNIQAGGEESPTIPTPTAQLPNAANPSPVQTQEWFHAINKKLHWSDRSPQVENY